MDKKWYQRTWVILISLIAFLPLGLILLWKNKELRSELAPTLKWTAIAMGCIFIYGAFFRDNVKPVIKAKSEISIIGDKAYSEQEIVDQAIISVSDNQTDLSNKDVKIMHFDKLDLSKKGKQTVKFLVHDKAANTSGVETIVNIK